MDNRNLSTDQNAIGNNTKRNIGLVLAYLFFSLDSWLLTYTATVFLTYQQLAPAPAAGRFFSKQFSRGFAHTP
jgi:hypothetical protein